MQEAKDADEKLKAYSEGLNESFQNDLKAFQDDYAAIAAKAQKGELAPAQLAEEEQRFAKQQQALAKKEQELVEKVQKKRQELLAPILTRVDEAIKAVGKEGGYTMIFDSSMVNAILFADEAQDIEPLVRQKLGM